MASKAVFWVGTNGNIYVKDNSGVRDAGKAIKVSDGGFDAERFSGIGSRIDDPVQQKSNGQDNSTPSGASGGSSGGGNSSAPAPVLNRAALDATYAAIDSLGTERSVGNKNIDDSLGSVISGYDRERARNEGDYNDQTVTNNQNFARNKQNALVAGAQGLRGLRGVLSSIGALSGDGTTLANRAVTKGVNEDVGGAAETTATNQLNLDKAIGNFREEDDRRREEARVAAENNRTALEGNILSKKQSYLQKLAEINSQGGNTGEADRLLREAGSLNTPIASKTAVAATPIAAKSAAFTPGALESYLAGAGDMTAQVTPSASGQQSTVLFGRRDKKEKEATALA